MNILLTPIVVAIELAPSTKSLAPIIRPMKPPASSMMCFVMCPLSALTSSAVSSSNSSSPFLALANVRIRK